MRIVFGEENLCKMLKPTSGKNKENISNCHLLKLFIQMQSICNNTGVFVKIIEKPTGLKYHDSVSYRTLDMVIIS